MGNDHACGVCWRDSLKSDGCGVTAVFIGGERYERIPFYGNTGERCPNCNALSGHYHH